MRAFWLTWMWFTRGLMASCVILGIMGATAGDAFLAVISVISLAVNAASAEFCRRQL